MGSTRARRKPVRGSAGIWRRRWASAAPAGRPGSGKHQSSCGGRGGTTRRSVLPCVWGCAELLLLLGRAIGFQLVDELAQGAGRVVLAVLEGVQQGEVLPHARAGEPL